MRRILYTLVIVFSNVFCHGQETDGIQFETRLNWSEIKEYAKKEHKYIFVDAFTSWCVPCKKMSKDIFPLKRVGDFFNKNFISVAIQFDSTGMDTRVAREWYKDAELIKNQYSIESYPTYLFFNSDGQVVQIIRGAIFDPGEFIAKAKESINPERQLFSLKKHYDKGNRADSFLLTLINSAQTAGDSLLSEYVNTYLAHQRGLLTIHNFKIAALGVTKREDLAYKMILDNPVTANAALGKWQRAELLNRVIFENEVFPLLRKDGKIKKSRYMIIYEGEINQAVDWEKIEASLTKKYADIGRFIYTDARLTYFMWTKDWANFNTTMKSYTAISKDLNLDYVARMVSYLIAFSDRKEEAVNALDWAKILLQQKNIPQHKKDYSRLLYKAGNQKEAVDVMQSYINTKGVDDEAAEKNIDKMKRGEDIYW